MALFLQSVSIVWKASKASLPSHRRRSPEADADEGVALGLAVLHPQHKVARAVHHGLYHLPPPAPHGSGLEGSKPDSGAGGAASDWIHQAPGFNELHGGPTDPSAAHACLAPCLAP